MHNFWIFIRARYFGCWLLFPIFYTFEILIVCILPIFNGKVISFNSPRLFVLLWHWLPQSWCYFAAIHSTYIFLFGLNSRLCIIHKQKKRTCWLALIYWFGFFAIFFHWRIGYFLNLRFRFIFQKLGLHFLLLILNLWCMITAIFILLCHWWLLLIILIRYTKVRHRIILLLLLLWYCWRRHIRHIRLLMHLIVFMLLRHLRLWEISIKLLMLLLIHGHLHILLMNLLIF